MGSDNSENHGGSWEAMQGIEGHASGFEALYTLAEVAASEMRKLQTADDLQPAGTLGNVMPCEGLEGDRQISVGPSTLPPLSPYQNQLIQPQKAVVGNTADLPAYPVFLYQPTSGVCAGCQILQQVAQPAALIQQHQQAPQSSQSATVVGMQASQQFAPQQFAQPQQQQQQQQQQVMQVIPLPMILQLTESGAVLLPGGFGNAAGWAVSTSQSRPSSSGQWDLSDFHQPPIPVPPISVTRPALEEAAAGSSDASLIHPATSPAGTLNDVATALFYHSAPLTPCQARDATARVSETGRGGGVASQHQVPPDTPAYPASTNERQLPSGPLSHSRAAGLTSAQNQQQLQQRIIDDAARNVMPLTTRVLDLSHC